MPPTLYLIRHAKAAEQGRNYPDDSQRPLIAKGFKQAQTLTNVFKTLGVKFDKVYSSPYTRAAQTAEPLLACLKKKGSIVYLETLTNHDYSKLLEDISKLQDADTAIALVGHEPYLSKLASYLLSRETHAVKTNFKKSAFMVLSGELSTGQMKLEMLLPFAVYKNVNGQ
jgi:phosphohistidine phosphatase